MTSEIINSIKDFLKLGKVSFKRHALVRLLERRITVSEVEEVLLNPTLIESYPDDKPLPSYLIGGKTTLGRALHIVIALDEPAKYIWIITVYEPDTSIWENEYQKRKKL